MRSLIRVANPHHFSADPDPELKPTFHFNADSDPAFHFNAAPDPNPAPDQGDANLRPLPVVYRHSRAPFEI